MTQATVTTALGGRAPVRMTVSGGRELQILLARLPVNAQKRVVRSAVSKVARHMVTKIKRTIGTGSTKAIDSGLLKKSIGFRTWTSKKRKWVVGATIGARKGFGTMVVRNKKGKQKALTRGGIAKHVAGGGGFHRSQYADPAKYAHLPEGGAKGRTGRKGRRVGAFRGVHFMEHSHTRYQSQMSAKLRRGLHVGIEREALKLSRMRPRGY
jgi:hypothetical protein